MTTDHASAAGAICTDDGTGCCSTCGVSLTPCECGGVGYHKAGCPDSDVTDENLTNELTHEQITYARDNIARLPGSLQIVDITLALACDAALSGDPAPEARARIAAAINASATVASRG